jgi:lipopolysaccharide exporter
MAHKVPRDMTDLNSKPANLKSSFIRGAAWSMAMRWSIKLLGLVSTVILARILSPADYGLVTMAMLAVGLTEVLVNFGAETNILREQNLNRDIIDSAWSLRVIQGCIVSALLAISAPLAGLFFKEPEVVWIIWIIAAGVFVASFANIGITVARKNFQFALEYRFNIISKVIGVVITIIAALILKDYRALVLGIVAGYLSGVVLSYGMHPYRPAWNTTHFRSMWHFSKWLLISGIGNYATRNTDQLITGRLADAHILGIYSVGSEIGQLPTAELGPPIMRAFLPTLSTIKDDMNRVRTTVLKTLGAINTLTIATACGFAAVAEPMTLVLLGEKWAGVAPYLAIFAMVGAFKVAVAPFTGLFLLQGLSKLHAQTMWAEFLAFILAAALLAPHMGVLGLAYARLISVMAYFAINLYITKSHAGIRYRQVLKVLWRPVIGSLIMVAALTLTPLLTANIYLELIQKTVMGAIVYTSFIFLTWKLCGRPDGIEATFLDHLKQITDRV